MSLAPRHLSLNVDSSEEGQGVAEWIGQVGLMDLEALYQRKGPWVASKSQLSPPVGSSRKRMRDGR